MTKTMFVKPLEGQTFRKPDGARIEAEGEHVPVDVFWTRRVNMGDVVVATPPVKSAKSK